MLAADPQAVLARLRGLCLADPDLDWAHVEARLLSSWRLAAPKRLAGA